MKLTKKMLLDIKEVHGHDIENITWVVNTLIAEVDRLQAVEAAARELLKEPQIAAFYKSHRHIDMEFAVSVPEYKADCESITAAFDKLKKALEAGDD